MKNKLGGVVKMKEYIEEVQKIIGIKFNEPKLLVTALTHSSYANQHREEGV